MDHGQLLSIATILSRWSAEKQLLDRGDFEDASSEPDEGVKDDWWNPKWIPITLDGGGSYDCLDLDPDEGGEAGQIISFSSGSAERERLAETFAEWFEAYVDAVLNGEYVYSDDYGQLVPADEA